MNVSNVNQIFSQKLQDINSRLPSNISVNSKFQSILDQTQQNNATEPTDPSTAEKSNTTTSDVNSLLQTMLSTQSLLNSTSFSSDTSSSLFPTSSLNNSINQIQQTQLLNALKAYNSQNN